MNTGAAAPDRVALERRLEELLEELRHYPSPISRWDAQIPALIEERASIVAQLRALQPATAPPAPERAALERRLDELMDEVRHYPTPIAGCDQHLPALLEERGRIVAQLRAMEDERDDEHDRGCSPAATWTNDGGFNAA